MAMFTAPHRPNLPPRSPRFAATTALATATLAALAATLAPTPGFAAGPDSVDFRYSPPEWQTAICLPDDPSKSIVDRSGELLYGYGQGGREFATRIGVEVVPDARWQRQELLSPRIPIVRTFRTADGLEILEEAFAVTDLRIPPPPSTPPAQAQTATPAATLRRLDGEEVNRNWANPPVGTDPVLRDIAVHMGGNLKFEVAVPPGAARRVALAWCEGWWKEPARRVQTLKVEGATPRTVDAVAELGPNQPGVFWFDAKDADADGRIVVAVEAAPQATDKNTVLNGLWVFAPDTPVDTPALLGGRLNATAQARLAANPRPEGPPRNDLILVRVTNTGTQPRELHPRLVIDTTLPFTPPPLGESGVHVGDEVVFTPRGFTGTIEERGSRRALELNRIQILPGKTETFHVVHASGRTVVYQPLQVDGAISALASREHAVRYWERAPLPWGRVTVPDLGVQALVDSSIRNIWQAREIKKGLPVFQVGPTCYRGLWIVDGAFLLESAALVGAGKDARSGITYTLSQQKPSGAFEVLSPKFFKENGIVLWTCVRHAMLTQDRAWLESVWPQLERAAVYITTLRQRSRENDTPLDDGLNPPGEIDGGLSGHGTGFQRPEFSNVHWNLLGLRAFIQAAHWLGKPDAAARWQHEYDDLNADFRKAIARDLRTDPQGHAYVPIFMANQGDELPQRAQWTFCHAVYPGQIFAPDDPLVTSTLAMLQATEREGMVYGTGWDATGIWNYFASFYGHAWLWQGNGPKAAQVLAAFANHASPTLVWREEQSLQGEKFKKVGDMPHNWASAEFIRLTIHLLALDRGDELHLLEGFPREWAGPGMVTRLHGVATPFGPLEMTVKADRRGAHATLSVRPLASNCRAIVVHQPDGTTRRLDPRRGGKVTFPVQ